MTNLRKAANGKTCTIRVPGFCKHTHGVVLAHYRLAGTCGVGMKPPDELGADACSVCHDIVDGRIQTPYERDTIRLWHAEGVMRTWMSRK